MGALPKRGALGKVDALGAAVALVALVALVTLLLLVTLVAGAVCWLRILMTSLSLSGCDAIDRAICACAGAVAPV